MSQSPRRSTELADLHVEATYRLTEALVEAEARMRRRVELLSEVVFETDAAGCLVFLNGASVHILGHHPEACLGQRLHNFIVEEDWPLLERGMRETQEALSADPLIRVRQRNGAIAWVEVSLARIGGGGVVGALHDVTQRKLAQDELAKLSLVASYTDNMVIITDRNGRTEWVKEAFTKRTGFILADLAGRKPGEVLQGPLTDRAVVTHIGEKIREGRSFRGELRNYTKRGEPYWVQFQVSPIRNQQGDVERFVSIQTDSTELHQTQEALEAARAHAEAANDAKTQFLATISHEMRTPLSAIIGSAALALDDAAGLPEARTHLARVSESAEILQRLISDVLDVAKIEAGQIDVECAPVPIRRCLQAAVAPAADRARAKGLEFRLMVDESLPAEMMGDPDRMRQIVTNLVENAVKFTNTGHVRVEASLLDRSELGPAALEIRVVDSGVGIPLEAQTRIFERFVQGDSSTTRRKGGAGLGLSIVKSLAEALGGAVRVRSRIGEGADFRVTLPLVPVSLPPSAAAVEPTVVGQTALRAVRPTARILVAEDNDINFAVIQSCLKQVGYTVERALDGQAATAAASRCDLILMDVEMPEVDGVEATRRIRAWEAENGRDPVPIIALTAHAMQQYRARTVAAGCTGYLAKPFHPRALQEAVAAALAHERKATREARAGDAGSR